MIEMSAFCVNMPPSKRRYCEIPYAVRDLQVQIHQTSVTCNVLRHLVSGEIPDDKHSKNFLVVRTMQFL